MKTDQVVRASHDRVNLGPSLKLLGPRATFQGMVTVLDSHCQMTYRSPNRVDCLQLPFWFKSVGGEIHTEKREANRVRLGTNLLPLPVHTSHMVLFTCCHCCCSLVDIATWAHYPKVSWHCEKDKPLLEVRCPVKVGTWSIHPDTSTAQTLERRRLSTSLQLAELLNRRHPRAAPTSAPASISGAVVGKRWGRSGDIGGRWF